MPHSLVTVATARWVGAALAATLLVLFVVGLHLEHAGGHAILESDHALAAGDGASAIVWARDAAMKVAPMSPYPEQGYARLTSIAKAAESRGDFDQAAFAWRATITAIRATRSEAGEASRLDEAKRSLIRIAGRVCEGSQTRSLAACSATTEAALAEDGLPTLPTFTWLALGGALFFGGGAGLSRRGPTTRNRQALFALTMVLGVLFASLALASR